MSRDQKPAVILKVQERLDVMSAVRLYYVFYFTLCNIQVGYRCRSKHAVCSNCVLLQHTNVLLVLLLNSKTIRSNCAKTLIKVFSQ